jgi:urease accessory protein
VARWDAPLLWRLLQGLRARDGAAVATVERRFLASRDTAELRAETVQMGYSLARLVAELGVADARRAGPEATLPPGLRLRRRRARHPARGSAAGDAVFLGREPGAGVREVGAAGAGGRAAMLLSLRPDIERAARWRARCRTTALSNWAPGLSMLSMRHEVQHGRLYRS